MIRRLKLAYELYNFFHKQQLKHNIPLYKRYGINKRYYSSVSSKDFAHVQVDSKHTAVDISRLEALPYYQGLDAETQASIRSFDDVGYCVIRGFWTMDKVNIINDEIERMVRDKTLTYEYNNKLMFAIHHSDKIRDLCSEPDFNDLLDVLINGDAHLFQSINFTQGSQQKTHSDSIHMTTFPLGGLLGVWLALETIGLDNGPVHYYPRSHKLPYYMNGEYDNEGSRLFLGDKGYKAYEVMIENKINDMPLEKKVFTAEAGDLFIWHANLLHGGEPHTNKERTRKSMVLHYYDRNRICYHEVTQRPALLR